MEIMIHYEHARFTALPKALVNWRNLNHVALSCEINNQDHITSYNDKCSNYRYQRSNNKDQSVQTTNLLAHFLREAAYVQRALLVVREVRDERHLSMRGD